MKLHFISYFFSLFLNFIFLTSISLSFYLATYKVKEEEVKVSLISPSGIYPTHHPAQETSLSFQKKPFSTDTFLDRTSSVKSSKKEKETSEKDIVSERISKLMAQKETEKVSKLTQEEIEELEGRLKGLKGRAQGDIQGIPQKGEGTFLKPLSEGYLLLIKRKLQTNFEVPIYLKQKSGLKALVSIEISSTGEILSYKFLQASEEPLFNQAIERCLKISQPFPVNTKVKILVEFKAEGIGKIN